MTPEPIRISEAEYHRAGNDCNGFCLHCRTWEHGDCEPDMRKGLCTNCGKNAVYGTEELLIMGLIHFT